MFQLLADGSVDKWSKIVRLKGIPFGFGGLASLNGGAVPGSMILKEHYRLGSSMVIISRAFCNTDLITDPEVVKRSFYDGIAEIRDLEAECQKENSTFFAKNQEIVRDSINIIVNSR